MKDQTKEIIRMMVKLLVPKDKRSRGRHDKESLSHYIEVMCYILRTGIQWNQLKEKLHYTTYHKKFMKWCKYKVFENAHRVLVRLLKTQKYLTDENLKNLFIDSTMIKNIKGCKDTGVNHYDRGRQGNKVNVIVTRTGIPLGMTITTSNVHDIKTVESVIDQVNVKIVGSRVIADKGYVSGPLKKKLLKERKIYLVCPKKLGQLGPELPPVQKKLLAQRNIIENFFAWTHNFRRIRVRYERKIEHYKQFYYLGMIEVIAGKNLI